MLLIFRSEGTCVVDLQVRENRCWFDLQVRENICCWSSSQREHLLLIFRPERTFVVDLQVRENGSCWSLGQREQVVLLIFRWERTGVDLQWERTGVLVDLQWDRTGVVDLQVRENRCFWLLLCSAIFCSQANNRSTMLLSHSDSEWLIVAFHNEFWIAMQMVYLKYCLVVAWLVPHEAAAISAHALCKPCNHAPVYSVISCEDTYVGCMCV